MALENAKFTYGLSATAAATSINTSGDFTLGIDPTILLLPEVTNGYSFGGCIYGNGDSVTFSPLDGVVTIDDAFVAGTAQVETANAAGTTSGAGNVSVTFTAAAVTGSPITVSVAVASGDTASTWAAKVRTALSLNTAISSVYTISGTGTSIVATRIPLVIRADCPSSNYANDSTLNIALANGSPSPGITPAATSANTTAGVATDGAYILKGDGNNYEGNPIGTMTEIHGILLACEAGAISIQTSEYSFQLNGASTFSVGKNGSIFTLANETTVSAGDTNSSFTLTILGK